MPPVMLQRHQCCNFVIVFNTIKLLTDIFRNCFLTSLILNLKSWTCDFDIDLLLDQQAVLVMITVMFIIVFHVSEISAVTVVIANLVD